MSLVHLAQEAEQQRLQWIGGGVVNVLLDGAATDGQLTALRSRLPGGSASPVHVHSREDEVFVLLSGAAVFWAGEQRHELSAGGVVFLPRGLPHAYRFLTDDVDLLTLCVPSGIEEFFRAAGHDLAEPVPAGWQLSQEAMAAAAVAGGQHVLGPPLGAGDTMPAEYLAAV